MGKDAAGSIRKGHLSHILALAVFVVSSGSSCSYHGELRPAVRPAGEDNAAAIQLTAAVVQGADAKSSWRYSEGWETYEISYYPGLGGATRDSLAGLFERISLVESVAEAPDNALLVFPALEVNLVHANRAWGQRSFKIAVSLLLERGRTRYLLGHYREQGKFLYSPPAGRHITSFLTGLSLFTLAPITESYGVHISGKHGKRLLEDAVGECLERLSERIARDRQRLVGAAKGPVVPGKAGAEGQPDHSVPSQYEDFLDAVVVIRTSRGTGSGFFASPVGHIVTNAHVVGTDSTVSIRFRSGLTQRAQVLGSDESRDVALLRGPTGHEWLALGTPDRSMVAKDVLAIGCALGLLDWTMSKGIVSALREFGGVHVVQTDAAINRGNSGGPLILADTGKVVGVNTFGFSKEQAEGLSFAISAAEVVDAFPALVSRPD